MVKQRASTIMTLAAAAVGIFSAVTLAAPITPGNLVVMRIGDGTTTIASTTDIGAALQEYTAGGALVQTIPLDSTNASATRYALTSTKTEGILSISPDGRYVTFGGYRANVGASNGSGAAGTVDRVIGRLDTTTGIVDTSTEIDGTANYSNDSFRSVAADNTGTAFWLSGAAGATTSGGVRYIGSGFGGITPATSVYSPTSANTRQIQILNGNLFVSSGSAVPSRSVFQVGSGVPTTGSQTLTASFPAAATDQYNSFFFADLTANNWNSTGYDTLYAADTQNNRLEKFSFDGASWNAAGNFTLTNLIDITGVVNGGNVTLYGTVSTTTTGQVLTLTDTGGSAGSISALSFSNLTSNVVAGTNFAWRGISIVPVPEPASLALLSLAALPLLRRRRR